MVDPVRTTVLAAAKTALSTIAGVAVHHNRTAKVVSFPALVLVDGGQRANDQTLGATQYAMDFAVEGYVQAADDAALGPARDALMADVVAALLADVTLGGLAMDLHEGETDVELDRGDGKAPTATFVTTFTVDYWTDEGNPRAAGP